MEQAPTEVLEGYEDLDECPECGSGEVHYHEYIDGPDAGYELIGDVWRCQNCGFQWYGVDAVTPDMVLRIGVKPKWGENENYKHYIND